MNERDVAKLARKLDKQFSWLSDCVQRFDATDIGEQHDLMHLLTSKTLQKDKDLAERASAQEKSAESQSVGSRAIESMKQKIKKLEESGRLNEITSKRDKGKDKER